MEGNHFESVLQCISVINLENESERQKKKSLLPYGHWWGKLSAHYSLTFFCKGVWRVTTSTWYINISLIKLDIIFDLMYLGCVLELPCFIKLLRVWQQISALWCKTAEITITSLEKPKCWFLFFFYVLGEFKKKPSINIFVYHAHGFTQNLFFFCIRSLSSESIIKNTYLHIFSNCDYFSDWYWITTGIYSQPRKFVVNHGWKYYSSTKWWQFTPLIFYKFIQPRSMVQGLDTHTNKLSIFQIERCS